MTTGNFHALLPRKFIPTLSRLAVEYGGVELTSGQQSNYYINIKHALSTSTITKELINILKSEIKYRQPPRESWGAIAGIADGTSALSGALTYAINQRSYGQEKLANLLVRKEVPGHGRGKRLMGARAMFNGRPRSVVVLEDVVTTGGSLINALKVIREAAYGGQSLDLEPYAFAIVLRDSSALARINDAGYGLAYLTTAKELLDIKRD